MTLSNYWNMREYYVKKQYRYMYIYIIYTATPLKSHKRFGWWGEGVVVSFVQIEKGDFICIGI